MKERRAWTAEQKFAIALDVLPGNKWVAEMCRENQISCNQFYKWKNNFLTFALEGLKNKHLKVNKDQVVKENHKLLRLLGRYALMVEEQKNFFHFYKVNIALFFLLFTKDNLTVFSLPPISQKSPVFGLSLLPG